MRKNQKGFTLVELIIAVAILAIVTAAVCGFIVVGSRSYASSNTDIMLQQDAQLALNQMSDVIIDTTDSISYGLSTSGSDNMQLVLKDSEFAGEATEKCLIVVNRHEEDSNNLNPSYWFYWRKDDEAIYFNEVPAYSSSMSPADVENAFKNAGDDKAILAQHVTDFSIDISQFEANRVVMISMTFENGNRTYSTSNNVTVRNRIALNEITVGPLRRAEDFEIDIVPNVTVEPGESINLGDKVTVETSSGDTALKWEFNAMNGTTLSESTGLLNVGLGETRETFNVKVSRLNEEYAGQNERVAKTIKVNVKRATSVEFSGPSSAKQGETISLSAQARDRIGLLGMACNGDNHLPDITKDKDVDRWRVMSGDAEIVTSDSGSASVLIHNSATVGSKVVIRAESTLSKTPGRSYGFTTNPTESPVWGEHVITVQQGVESSAIPLGSDLIYGSDNSGTNMTYDYIRNSMPAGVEYTKVDKYVFCIRVREENDPSWHSPDDDWYLVYLTSAANMRFAPDLFGLDMTKSYKVYLQALLPMPKEIFNDLNAFNERRNSGEWWDSYNDIWEEYSNNLSGEGKYTGDLYYATELYYAELNPPALQLDFENKTYPYEDKSYQEVINLLGGTRGLGRPSLNKTGTINIDTNIILNNLAYTIYKEDDKGNWNRIYGPTYDTEGTVTLRSGLERIANTGMSATQNGNSLSFPSTSYSGDDNLGTHQLQPTASTFLNYNNQNGDKSKAIGKYHIVPGYLYANNPIIRAGEYDEEDIIKKKTDNYWGLYYYKEWDCVMNFEITLGLTLELSYEGKKNSVELINFPLPTYSDFPFTKNSDTVQEKTMSSTYDIYNKDGSKIGSISNLTVRCTYDSGKYTIKLWAEEKGNKVTVMTDYGTYVWDPGATKWEAKTAGQGSDITGGALVYFDAWGRSWKIEVEVPSELSGDKHETIQQMLWFLKDDPLSSYSNDKVDTTLDYKDNGGEWTLTVSCGGENFGTWKWNGSKSEWVKQ